MVSESEILSDLKTLSKCSLYNPAYNYYINKINIQIREEFEKGNLSQNQQKSLMTYLLEITNRINFANFYRVLKEYKVYTDFGNNILNRVSLEDLLIVRNNCCSLLFLGENNNLEKITSDGVAKLCTEKLLSNCKELMIDKSNNDLYYYMDLLGKNLYNCRMRRELVNFSIENFKTFIKWKRELLEFNKEFYYLPRVRTSSVREINSFSKESKSDEIDGHREYYVELFSIDLLENLVFQDENYFNRQREITKSVEKIGFSPNIEDYVKTQINNFLVSFGEYKEPTSVIVSNISNRVDSLSYYPKELLESAYELAKEFCDDFSKISLLGYCIKYADLLVRSSSDIFDSSYIFNNSLESSMKTLMSYKIITEDEMNTVYEKYRRG